jgi:uncharacterized membrane protein
MTYTTKTEFLTGLRETLERNNVTDLRDILSDFRQHFEDGAAVGESEEEVCRKLGDVDDIVQQYISENPGVQSAPAQQVNTAQQTSTSGDMPEASGFGAEGSAQQPYSQPRYAEQQAPTQGADAGKIVGVICLDLFVYSWALPTLFGLIIALMSITVAFSVIGIVCLLGGIVAIGAGFGGLIVTGFAPVSVACLGIMFIGFAGMLVIGSIGSVKGFINLCIAIINQHSRACAGRNVLNKIGQKGV